MNKFEKFMDENPEFIVPLMYGISAIVLGIMLLVAGYRNG